MIHHKCIVLECAIFVINSMMPFSSLFQLCHFNMGRFSVCHFGCAFYSEIFYTETTMGSYYKERVGTASNRSVDLYLLFVTSMGI